MPGIPPSTALVVITCGAFACYAIALLVAAVAPRYSRWPLMAAVVGHTGAMLARGWSIGYFPLTNKFESFSTFALAVGLVAVFTWRPNRRYLLPLLAATVASAAGALTFDMTMRYPPPLMQTIWYPLHVPLSFLGYALWIAAGSASLAWTAGRPTDWLRRIDKLALQGLGLWSLGMICGGVWGVLAWGAYFLWDPKVIWSVILWVHYASFVHIRLTPSLRTRPWVRPALAGLGVVWVFVAYVGTSFLFGKSSHSFG